jgi:Uma2 family endonuclease
MPTVAFDSDSVTIPGWVTDLDAFRRWLDSDPLPEKASAWFLGGEVWVDMSREQLFTHGDIKTEVAAVLHALSKAAKSGRYWCNGLLLSNRAADLSGKPDGTFVSTDSFAAGRVQLIPGREGGFVELAGTPDMVLEVISDSSETKDTVTLVDAYFAADIPEYWLVDARGAEIAFTVYARGPTEYERVADAGGWVRSGVFGREFRLTRGTDPAGNPEFTLEVRPGS